MYGSTLSTRHFQLSSCSIALIPSFTSNFDSLLACFWHQHPPIDEIGSEYERCTETKNNRIGSFPSQYPINILSRAHLYISQLHFLDLVLHLLPCMHSWIPTGVLIHVSGPQCFHPRESLLQRKLLHFLVLATSMHDNTCMLLVPQGMLASTTRRMWLAFFRTAVAWCRTHNLVLLGQQQLTRLRLLLQTQHHHNCSTVLSNSFLCCMQWDLAASIRRKASQFACSAT